MALLFLCPGRDMSPWAGALRAVDPNIPFRFWPEDGPPEDIQFVVSWKHPAGALHRYPNLRAVLSLGAGIDHFTADPDLPAHLTYGRIVDPYLVEGMSQYVAAGVVNAHRGLLRYRDYQQEHRWAPELYDPSDAWPVGILGVGAMGADSARVLRALGYPVLGWSRTPRKSDLFESFAGPDGLRQMLPRCRALVCLLPLTPDTRGLIGREVLGLLPRGAYLINAGRGAQVDDDAVLEALGTGHLAGACLDVFHTEPLPATHPYWSHPNVVVTPHIASVTNPATAARQVAVDYHRALAGQALSFPVDLRRGY